MSGDGRPHAWLLRWIACAGALTSLLACAPQQGVAQERESLRERIRERLQERRAQREQPATTAASSIARIDKPGDYRFEIEHGGLQRVYRVHVPPGYNGSKPVPVVFAFHGGGANMDIEADDKYYHLTSKSDRSGIVAVFPNGYSPFPSGKFATWNAGNCCAGAAKKNIDGVGFVREIVARLKSQLNVDSDRIYATGFSNGAMFTYRLACEAADIFRAIASVAGSEGVSSCHPSEPVGILEIHARNDDFMPFGGGAGTQSRTKTDFLSVEETISRWVRRNSCNATPKRVFEVAGAYCNEYQACAGDSRVRLCVTEDGGHSWPGGVKVRTGEAGSKAVDATDMIWEFFTSR